MSYNSPTQQKNLAWFLPRPKPDHYKGGMPLGCEKWLLDLAREIGGWEDPRILNLFCGMNKEGFRVDLNPEVKPDLLADAHKFTSYFVGDVPVKSLRFDVILADPPYSDEENETLYGFKQHLSYRKWVAECSKVLEPGGFLIVYHKLVMPNPDPTMYSVIKRVFIGNRTGHLPRVAIYFMKMK